MLVCCADLFVFFYTYRHLRVTQSDLLFHNSHRFRSQHNRHCYSISYYVRLPHNDLLIVQKYHHRNISSFDLHCINCHPPPYCVRFPSHYLLLHLCLFTSHYFLIHVCVIHHYLLPYLLFFPPHYFLIHICLLQFLLPFHFYHLHHGHVHLFHHFHCYYRPHHCYYYFHPHDFLAMPSAPLWQTLGCP